jgi:DNA-binding response OmpR family regulator
MSGYLEQVEGNDEFFDERLFIQKPFSRQSLLNRIGEALRSEASSKVTETSPARVGKKKSKLSSAPFLTN